MYNNPFPIFCWTDMFSHNISRFSCEVKSCLVWCKMSLWLVMFDVTTGWHSCLAPQQWYLVLALFTLSYGYLVCDDERHLQLSVRYSDRYFTWCCWGFIDSSTQVSVLDEVQFSIFLKGDSAMIMPFSCCMTELAVLLNFTTVPSWQDHFN